MSDSNTQPPQDKQDGPEELHPTIDEGQKAIEEAYLEDLARSNAYEDFVEEEALRLLDEEDPDDFEDFGNDEVDPWTLGDQLEADGGFDFMSTPYKQLFDRGRLIATRAAVSSLGLEGMLILAGRHFRLDPGDLDKSDQQLNCQAIKDGSQIVSAYTVDGVKYYVITDAEDDDGKRSTTTILRADEY